MKRSNNIKYKGARQLTLWENFITASWTLLYTHVTGFPSATLLGLNNKPRSYTSSLEVAVDLSRRSPKMAVFVPRIFGEIKGFHVTTQKNLKRAWRVLLKLGIVNSWRLVNSLIKAVKQQKKLQGVSSWVL